MRAYYLDNPSKIVSKPRLESLGVLYWHVPADTYKEDGFLEKICQERSYKNRDEVRISPTLIPNYEEKLKIFFTEHLHEDEEIRYILDGSGFFDIRDEHDEWIRIHVVKSDMIVLPAGIYHRFAIDPAVNWAHAMRLFKDEPKWTPYNRDDPTTDQRVSRKQYRQFLEEVPKRPKKIDPNGQAYVLQEGAKQLAHYPHMREANGFLYISGLSSRLPNNTHAGATKNPDGTWTLDIKEQTKAVIENVEKCLQMARANLSHVVDISVFLVNMKDYEGMNEVYNRYFDEATGPTRTTVAVHQLPHPNLLIEIKAVAVVPKSP